MPIAEGCAAGGDCRRDPGLVHGDDIGVSLDDHRRGVVGDRLAGPVQARRASEPLW